MSDIVVIGDRDSIYGFAALGLDTFFVKDDTEDVRKNFLRALKHGYKIIYITEGVAAYIPNEIEKVMEQVLPAVILIPGSFGNTGAGIRAIKKSVEQAVGSDILFRD